MKWVVVLAWVLCIIIAGLILCDNGETKMSSPDNVKKNSITLDTNKNIYKDGIKIGSTKLNIDAKSLEVLNMRYAKDKNQVMYLYVTKLGNIFLPLDLADAASFEAVGSEYGKDRNRVYFCDRIVDGAEPKTFEALNHSYARDKHAVFGHGKKTELDPKTINILSSYYQIDTKGVHYAGRTNVIASADPSTFSVIKDSPPPYAKDARAVYYGDCLIVGANPASFILLSNDIGKDKVNVFHCEKIISLADVSSFRVLNEYFAIDSGHVYCQGKLIEGADAATFKVAGNSQCQHVHNIVGYDKNFIYYYESYGKYTKCEITKDKNFIVVKGELRNRKWWHFW